MMKKVLVVLVCLVGMTAMAQKEERQHGDAKNDMTPEQMATLKTKRMTLALDLTNAQQKQVQSLNLENAKIRKAKKKEREIRRENNAAKKPTSSERYAIENEHLDHMIAQKAKMKNILSVEQYGKWEKMVKRMGKHRKGKKEGERKNHTRK